MSEKVQLVLTDDALKVIAANATERRRGEFVSRIVTEYANLIQGVTQPDEDTGLLERIDTRLARIERQLAALMTKVNL